MSAPDPNTVLLGSDPIPAIATPSQRALLEWAAANPLATPHPGMTADGSRYAPDVLPDGTKGKATTRVTTFAAALDDGQGLIRWRHRILAHGLATAGAIIEGDAPSAAYDQQIAKALHQAGEKLAADVGSAIHLALEHHVTGTGIAPPAPWDADVAAVSAMLAAHQLRPVFTEAVLWVPIGKGLCGTADLLVAGPWGDELRVLDYKTGSRVGRIGYATQLACYTKATHRWTDEGWAPLPAIDRTKAYIAHVPAGTGECELVEVTIKPELVELASAVRNERRQANVSGLFRAVEAPPSLFDDATDLGGGATPEKDPTAESSDHEAEMRAWMLDRVRAVVARGGEAAAALSRRWPEGVSATEPETWSTRQMIELADVLVQIEAAHGIEPEFPPLPPAEAVAVDPEPEPPRPPSMWDIDDPDGELDAEVALSVTAGFAALNDEQKTLAASWAKGGKTGGRHWAVGADALRPRTLAIYATALACLTHLWNGDTDDTDTMTRAALCLVLGDDAVQPAWETGAILGALTIDQATRLAVLAEAFAVSGEQSDELSAKALALAV